MSVDLITGGTSKAGTTALYDMLRQHPDIFLPQRKELHYFSRPDLAKRVAGPGDAAVLAEIPATLEAYLAHYAGKGAGQIALDISPSYLFHHTCAARIDEALPHATVVFCLRNPLDKAFSHYVPLLGEARETLSFEEALKAEADRKAQGFGDVWLYAESGYYADAVEAFQTALGPDRVKVVLFDDLRTDPHDVLSDICDFAGLMGPYRFETAVESNVSGAPRSALLARAMAPNGFTNALRRILPARLGQAARRALRGLNTAEKPTLLPQTRDILLARYDADIARLEALIGRKTGWRRPTERP